MGIVLIIDHYARVYFIGIASAAIALAYPAGLHMGADVSGLYARSHNPRQQDRQEAWQWDAGHIGEHSVFAKGFLDVLNPNIDIMEGQRLYREVPARVAYAASRIRFKQLPEYALLQHAGHESGDFFLVPMPSETL